VQVFTLSCIVLPRRHLSWPFALSHQLGSVIPCFVTKQAFAHFLPSLLENQTSLLPQLFHRGTRNCSNQPQLFYNSSTN